MKNCLFLLSAIIIVSSCSVSFHVVEKKTTEKIFRKILTIYVNDPYDFSLLDSTIYGIAITGYFTEPDKFKERVQGENLISGYLSSGNTEIIKCSDMFQQGTYSYSKLRSLIDSLGIDAILFLDIASRSHTLATNFSLAHNDYFPRTFSTTRSQFECYLIDANVNQVVWSAQADIKGSLYSGKGALTRAVVRDIQQNLVSGIYIAPN